jgi:hypothetical protein
MSKAFDLVPFTSLLNILHSDYDVPIVLLRWLSSYFSERKQAVRAHGCYSNWHAVKAGVIQGSIIGPLLFSAYINELARPIAEHSKHILFADDLLLLAPFNNSADFEAVQASMDGIAHKTAKLHMKLNRKKCSTMTFSEGRHPYKPDRPLVISGDPITETTTEFRYLGVYFDCKLDWSANTRRVVAKAKKAIGSIRRLFGKILTENQMKVLILSKVVPIFTYGLVAAYPTLKGDMKLLERLGRYMCRVIFNDYTSSYEDLLARAGGQPLFQLFDHRRILLGHRYCRGKRYQPPGVIQELYQNPRMRLRCHPDSITVQPPSPFGFSNSALEDIATLWNRLPSNLATKSFNCLKLALRHENYIDNGERGHQMSRVVQLL